MPEAGAVWFGEGSNAVMYWANQVLSSDLVWGAVRVVLALFVARLVLGLVLHAFTVRRGGSEIQGVDGRGYMSDGRDDRD